MLVNALCKICGGIVCRLGAAYAAEYSLVCLELHRGNNSPLYYNGILCLKGGGWVRSLRVGINPS